MKARELAALLLKEPEAEVRVQAGETGSGPGRYACLADEGLQRGRVRGGAEFVLLSFNETDWKYLPEIKLWGVQ